ncbi:MAG: hypothetical protein ACMUIG_10650 [Thermoplasmatota archaeon]
MHVGICIPVSNNEMLISSKIMLLRKYISNRFDFDHSICIIDNGSTDRTTDVAHDSGALVIKYKKRTGWDAIIDKAIKSAVEKKFDVLVIYDGNSTIDPVDVIQLIDSFLSSKNRSAMGFISSDIEGSKESKDIECWIFDSSIFSKINITAKDIYGENEAISIGQSLGLSVEKKETLKSREDKKPHLLRLPLKSPWDLLKYYRKTYPLRFYGGLSGGFFLVALSAGIYEINHFVDTSNLDYVAFFIVLASGGIGLLLLSAGIIMNALNVLSEKVRGMMASTEEL